MTRSRKLLIGGAVIVALSAGGVGLAQAVSSDDEQATGPEADRAKAAAVDSVGDGRAVSVEREDEASSAWEVEVRRGDGSVLEVELGRNLERTAVERDDDDGADDDD